MLTLYYAPGACSMASHIGLEETGAPYETRLVSFANSEQRSEAYLKINSRGRVPALSVDGAILVENTAILTYLAKKFPTAKLLPADPLAEARCISNMAWFSNTVHPSFTHINRPERFADCVRMLPKTLSRSPPSRSSSREAYPPRTRCST